MKLYGLYHYVIIAALAIEPTLAAKSTPAEQQSLQQESTFSSSSLLSLHKELIEIESISGNENGVAKYLHNYLISHNFTVETQLVGPLKSLDYSEQAPRYNLLAYSGESRDTRILVSSHIDTVPPFWPYEVRERNDIWGRGSVDAKASVATQITAVQKLLASGEIEKEDVALLFVVGEEVGGDGMRKANELGLKWETVIFGEPTELKLASGHKGSLRFTVTAKGKAAHSGYPWLGENANSMLIPALFALDNVQLPSSGKYGESTLNIGRMEGGVAGNVIPELATATVTVRLAAGTPADVEEIIIDAVSAVDRRLEVEFASEGYGPVDIDSDVEGFDTIVVNYGTDIPNLKGDHKKYLYGPGSILVAHSDHEHIQARDLEEAVKGYQKLILAALKS